MENLKRCNICKKELEANSYNFSKNSISPDLLAYACKPCDNERRSKRFKEKLSHNIHRRCKVCGDFFYGELCKVKKGWYKFCGNKCRTLAKGLHRWEGKRQGEGNPRAKLQDEDVKEIIKQRGVSKQADICKKYGISRSTVYAIWCNLTWKHLER